MKPSALLVAAIACVASVVPVASVATQDQDAQWTGASIEVRLPDPFLKGKVDIRLKKNESRIESIALQVGGVNIPIPQRAYEDVHDVDLSTINVGYSPSHEGTEMPYIFIEVEYGDFPAELGEMGDPLSRATLIILIEDWKVTRRIRQYGGPLST